jgi:multicomponent Na+:H+ antiporter subunit B
LKKTPLIILTFFAVALIYSTSWLPNLGDPQSLHHREHSPIGSQVAADYYIKFAGQDAASPNIVTVILADYRAFDTLGEIIVILTAGIVCFVILRKNL